MTLLEIYGVILMRHFILDTSVIIRDPRVLAMSSDNVRIVIPEAAVLELASRASSSDAIKRKFELVQDALSHGVYRLGLPDSKSLSVLALQGATMPKLSGADLLIAKSAEFYVKNIDSSDSEYIFLVSEDKELLRYAESIGIKGIDLKGLENELKNIPVTDIALAKRAGDVSRESKRADVIKYISGLGSGVVVSIVANLLVTNFAVVVATINVWGTVILIPTIGISLFWFRSKYRLGYGIAEFIFGLLTALRVFYPN